MLKYLTVSVLCLTQILKIHGVQFNDSVLSVAANFVTTLGGLGVISPHIPYAHASISSTLTFVFLISKR